MSLVFSSGLRRGPLSTAGLHVYVTNKTLAMMKWHPEGITCSWRNMGPARSLHQISGVVSHFSPACTWCPFFQPAPLNFIITCAHGET